MVAADVVLILVPSFPLRSGSADGLNSIDEMSALVTQLVEFLLQRHFLSDSGFVVNLYDKH